MSQFQVASRSISSRPRPRSQRAGVQALALAGDVRDPAAMEAVVAQTAQTFGRLDIVVNGAAGNFFCLAENLSPNGFGTVVDIDLKGTFNVSRAAFPHLKLRKGVILNISATLQLLGTVGQAHASAAKAGVDALTRALAVEWGPAGVRVNAIAPGPVEGTEGVRRLVTPESLKMIEDSCPLGRLATIDDIARRGSVPVFRRGVLRHRHRPRRRRRSVAPLGARAGRRMIEPLFVRHSRARRYLIRVRPDGTVRVTIPRWGSKREAKAFAERERAWIDRQLARVVDRGSAIDGGDPGRANPRAARAGEARAPGEVAGVGVASRRHGVARQHQESALALGIVFSERAHLPELAAPADAGLGPRLRARSRVDAPETDGSLADILEAGSRGLSELSKRRGSTCGNSAANTR